MQILDSEVHATADTLKIEVIVSSESFPQSSQFSTLWHPGGIVFEAIVRAGWVDVAGKNLVTIRPLCPPGLAIQTGPNLWRVMFHFSAPYLELERSTLLT